MKCIYSKYLENGQLTDSTNFGNRKYSDCITIYEVIRIIGGVPLYMEQHFERLLKSAKLINQTIELNLNIFSKNIFMLSEQNNAPDGNIRIVAHFEKTSKKAPDVLIYFIAHNYPTANTYKQGISTGLYHAERKIPNVKIENATLRNKTNSTLSNENLAEVLLVNHNEEVTEGSKSNVFFIKGDTVYTPPASQVLEGITRDRVLSIYKENNIKYVEQSIKVADLELYDAAFITGTSPKVMPIKTIDNHIFNVDNVLLRKTMIHYDARISEYLRLFKI